METNRLLYFDQMKELAILLVVVGHVIQFSFGFKHSDVVNALAVFHMPIFFYVSGYLAYKTQLTNKQLLRRLIYKVLNLSVPLFVVGLSYCLFKQIDIVEWITSGFGGYWFLYVLLLLTIFFMLFEKLVYRAKKWYLYVILYLMPYIVIIYLKYNGFFGEIVNNLVAYYRYYLIGWMCHKYLSFKKILFDNKVCYAIAFFTYIAQWYFHDKYNIVLIFFCGMAAIVILQKWFCDNRTLSIKFLSYMGGK